ncbi:MAG: aminotransferase class I/II-fold pyridoxal phosphate-dependent enzyme [Candidatus Omnitrophica bacterium]|nr:aminotransferase class I/II-fold pyridoxal phosphate-dependent enzyme [Candidatus Omnitrophota bacterium]
MFCKAIPRQRVVVTLREVFNIFSLFFRGRLIKGDKVAVLEREFASYIGTLFAIAVGSGRFGLQLILETLGVKAGDEIIVPAYTFHAVPETIKKTGAVPVFVDINSLDYNIDTAFIEDKISPRTKAIIATHLFGTPCNLGAVLQIAKRHNLHLIEDCAQAIGAEYHSQKVGSFGDCAFFSFETVKPFHTFGGGMICTNDSLLYEKLKTRIEGVSYPKYSRVIKKISFSLLESVLTHPFCFTILVYPFLLIAMQRGKDLKKAFKKAKKSFKSLEARYANFQADCGIDKLNMLKRQLDKRISNASMLMERVKDRSVFQSPEADSKSIFYCLALKSNDAKRVSRALLRLGVDVDANLAQNCAEAMSCQDHPVAGYIANNVILIPIYPQLANRDIERIATALNQYV